MAEAMSEQIPGIFMNISTSSQNLICIWPPQLGADFACTMKCRFEKPLKNDTAASEKRIIISN